jgi:heptosyltransferase-2
MKILIVQTAFIGDVILTTPLVRAVSEFFKNSEIHFLTIPSSKNILENNPDIKKIIIYDKKNKDRGVINFFKFVGILKKEKYDIAIVPHRSLRSALLVFLSGIKRRIGFSRSAGWFLFSDRVKYLRDGRHEVKRNLNLLNPFNSIIAKTDIGIDNTANFDENKFRPEVFPTDEDKKNVDVYLQNLFSKVIISIAPGSVWATKRWLKERFAEVAKKLIKENNFAVVLIGGKEDFNLCEEIISLSGCDMLNLSGKLTLRESAEVIKRSELLITNDSAPLHLASAIGTKTIAIFGPTVQKFGFFPYNANSKVIEMNNLHCRPCSIHGGNKCPIGTFECMKGITADKVYGAVLNILKM